MHNVKYLLTYIINPALRVIRYSYQPKAKQEIELMGEYRLKDEI
jgi:hypothetical protein